MKKIEKTFCESLFQWQSENFKGTQTDLGKFLEVSQGQIANIFAKQRCGDETWRRMVAKKINVPYDKMIGLNNQPSKKTPEKNKPIQMDESIKIEKNHQNLVLKFKDKEKGLEANEALISLENIDRELFLEAVGELKGYAKAAKHIKKTVNGDN